MTDSYISKILTQSVTNYATVYFLNIKKKRNLVIISVTFWLKY